MSYEILTESYGRRLPKITAEADSTDDLTTLGTDWAEGSTCQISDTTYKLDKVQGWIDPNSGGGGGGGGDTGVLMITATKNESDNMVLDKTYAEILAAVSAGTLCVVVTASGTPGSGNSYSIKHDPVSSIGDNGDAFYVIAGESTFYADSDTDYPTT